MSFVEAIQSGFRNYAGFTGRAARSEYWYWALFVLIADLIADVLDFAMTHGHGVSLFGTIVVLGQIIPDLAVGVRRLHDRDKSGWFLLFCFIPLVGTIILIVWFCLRGTPGPNRFGEDPVRG